MQEFLRGAGIVCLYFVIAATTMFSARKLTRIPDELFRKLLHFVLQVSYILFAFAFETWWISVLAVEQLEPPEGVSKNGN